MKRDLAKLKAVNETTEARVQQETAESEALAASLQAAEVTCGEWAAAWAAREQRHESERRELLRWLQDAEAVNATTETRVQQETAEATSLAASCGEWAAAWAAREQRDESERAAKIWRADERLMQLLE